MQVIIQAIEVAITVCHMVNNTSVVVPRAVIDSLQHAHQLMLEATEK